MSSVLLDGVTYTCVDPAKGVWRLGGDIVHRMRGLGLMGAKSIEKRIPQQYLTASPQDRLELLQGLMDTDGDATTGGVCTFNTSSPHLRDQVAELVRGLGGIVTISSREAPKYTYKGEVRTGQPAYRLNVRLHVCPFALPRKAERWVPPNMARSIKKVTPAGTEMARCINVTTKRHLYIADGYIVTHNCVSEHTEFVTETFEGV